MITQRLILDGGTWTCVGCHGPLDEGIIQHPHDCPELRSGGEPGPLPSVAQLRAWLHAHGWAQQPPGPGGAFWCPPGCGPGIAVAVPHAIRGVADARFLADSLERIAKRSGLPFGEVLTAMRAIEVKESDHA